MAEELKLRRLETDDLFLVSAIFDKMDIDIDPKTLNDIGDDTSALEAGMKALVPVAVKAVRRLHMAQDEVRELLSSLSGKTVDEIRKMPPAQFIKAIRTVLQQEGVTDFLSSAQG